MINEFYQEAFEKTVIKAENFARKNFFLYKVKLFFYACFGYIVIFVVIALLLGLIGVTIGSAFFKISLFILLLKKKLLFAIIPTVWMMIKSLWVHFDLPEGYKLNRKNHYTVFKEVELLCDKLKSKKVHEIILTPEFNASIIQTPRLGILGWEKNTLILGFELLLTLSPDQSRAVIAHELGHLSGNHCRFNGWIYRIRITWQRIMMALENAESYGAKMMGNFFNWYSPRFEAYSFPLARANEYEADKISAQITSAEVAANALINTYVTAPCIDENYWSCFFKQADTLPLPPNGPWSELNNYITTHQLKEKNLKKQLQINLKVQTELNDTHPALKDRLKALNTPAKLPCLNKHSAAFIWFADKFEKIIHDFDTEWLEQNEDKWKERNKYVIESKIILSELSTKEISKLSDEELWKLSTLTDEFVDQEKAVPLLKEFQRRHPDDPDVAFLLGRIFFDSGKEETVNQMKIALNSPELAVESCRLSYLYLLSVGRDEDAIWWEKQAEKQLEIDEKSHKERSLLRPDDILIKPNIDQKQLDELIKIIKENEDVKKAWLAEKKLTYYPEIPALAIAIQFNSFFTKSNRRSDEIAEMLNLDCSIFVVPKSGRYKPLAKNIIEKGQQII